jgi:hypothetical protein
VAGRASAFKLVSSREGLFTAFALVLSGRELWVALQGLGKSGFEHADAVASLAAGVTGLFGGAAEVGAMVLHGSLSGGAATAGAVTATAFSRALAWRFGAGVLGAAGAGADAAAAFIKANRAKSAGDQDARAHYTASGWTLIGSVAASGGGAFVTWRAALAARAGQQAVLLIGRQVAVGAARGLILRTAAGALLGASLTGVGLVLFAAGILWALYAQSLEDDDNEVFLDRCYWGVNKRKEGSFGTTKPTNAKLLNDWMAAGMEAEMLSLGNLALGFKAEITDWNGNWFANDVIEFRFKFGTWKPEEQHFAYSLKAFKDKARTGVGVEIRKGPLPGEQPLPSDEGGFELALEQKVDDDIYQAVQLDFSFHRDGTLVGRDSLWATVND